MQARVIAVISLTAFVFVGPVVARAETAAESFAQGETLLAKGQFTTALQSYAAAARADRNNREYVQRYAMVRRIVDLRARLEAESDSDRRERSAKALRAFYVSERLYPDLLKIDQQLHARLASPHTAAMLAETQLAMGRHADAVTTLSALPQGKTIAMTEALLGIALARSGKKDEAKRIAGELTLPEEPDPSMTYAAARLYAGIGDSATSLELLQACLEATLPSMLDGFTKHAKECPEFAAMASSPEFRTVLRTQSKRAESKCSGGSSCAGCPMSGKCPNSQTSP
jgi:tetratricopeptide (TPR) repeat protein